MPGAPQLAVRPIDAGSVALHARAGGMSERLWAPWRMEYILGVKPKTCFFCDYAAVGPESFRTNLILVVQPHALVCLNRYPFAASHLLVAPRRHVADLEQLPPEEYDATMRLVRDAVVRLKRATNPGGVNVGVNLGKAAGAGVDDHLHVHAVPRWPGDSNFMPVLTDVRVMPEHLDESWRRLAQFFADVPGTHPTG
jgi:ATP adenylyltransferase